MVGPPVVSRKTVSFSSVLRGSGSSSGQSIGSSKTSQDPISTRSPKKSVSFNDNPAIQGPLWENRIAPHAKIDEINDEEVDVSDEAEEPHYQNSHAHQSQEVENHREEEVEGGYSLEDIDEVLSSKEPLREIWDNSAGNTPGVIGTQEVYKDPRQRMLEEKMKRERDLQMMGEGRDSPTHVQVPERLPFKEKMKMFATGFEQNKRSSTRSAAAPSRQIENLSGEDGQHQAQDTIAAHAQSEAATSS